jgi:hypothetical protein
MERVSHPVFNCAYLTFQYKVAKYLLHIPLYLTTATIGQSQAYMIILNPYIMYVVWVFVL